MELNLVENYLKKYFEGETTIAEEQALKTYFSSKNVAQHLKQYVPLFEYYEQQKEIQMPLQVTEKSNKQSMIWMSVAAAILIIFSFYTFEFQESNNLNSNVYGSFDTPEKAFAETQKALNLLSEKVNVGVQSMERMNEYEQSKNTIFKTN